MQKSSYFEQSWQQFVSSSYNNLFILESRFHQRSTYSFYARSSPKRKNSVKLSVSFYAFGTYERKKSAYN